MECTQRPELLHQRSIFHDRGIDVAVGDVPAVSVVVCCLIAATGAVR
jgi:hypothetical protein